MDERFSPVRKSVSTASSQVCERDGAKNARRPEREAIVVGGIYVRSSRIYDGVQRVIENNSIIHTRANNNDIANVKRDVRAFSRTNHQTILGVAFNTFSRFALNEI